MLDALSGLDTLYRKLVAWEPSTPSMSAEEGAAHLTKTMPMHHEDESIHSPYVSMEKAEMDTWRNAVVPLVLQRFFCTLHPLLT